MLVGFSIFSRTWDITSQSSSLSCLVLESTESLSFDYSWLHLYLIRADRIKVMWWKKSRIEHHSNWDFAIGSSLEMIAKVDWEIKHRNRCTKNSILWDSYGNRKYSILRCGHYSPNQRSSWFRTSASLSFWAHQILETRRKDQVNPVSSILICSS